MIFINFEKGEFAQYGTVRKPFACNQQVLSSFKDHRIRKGIGLQSLFEFERFADSVFDSGNGEMEGILGDKIVVCLLEDQSSGFGLNGFTLKSCPVPVA